MNVPRSILRGLVSPISALAIPDPNYIGWWPMTQWSGAVGALALDSYTATATSVVDATNNYVTGVTAETWLVAGTAVRVRSTGTIAGGLSATTTYWASKPDADKVRFHTSKAEALAGTNPVDITSQGTNNIVLYPGEVLDRSGQGNNMQLGANNNDLTTWGTAPWMSSASSGSTDTVLGRLAVAALNASWSWPTDTLISFFRVRAGVLVPGRSIWGNGVSTTIHGPAVALESTSGAKARILFCGSAAALTVGDTAATVFELNVEHSLGMVFDGPRATATAWVDGARDLSVNDLRINTAGAVVPTVDLRIGGRTATNAQAAGFRDYHLLSVTGSAPSNIDAIMARLHTSMFSRLRAGELR